MIPFQGSCHGGDHGQNGHRVFLRWKIPRVFNDRHGPTHNWKPPAPEQCQRPDRDRNSRPALSNGGNIIRQGGASVRLPFIVSVKSCFIPARQTLSCHQSPVQKLGLGYPPLRRGRAGRNV